MQAKGVEITSELSFDRDVDQYTGVKELMTSNCASIEADRRCLTCNRRDLTLSYYPSLEYCILSIS